MEGPYTSKEAVIAREEYLRAKAEKARVAWNQCLDVDDWAGMRRMSNIKENCRVERMYLIDELYRLLPFGHPNFKLYGDRLMNRLRCTGNHGLR